MEATIKDLVRLDLLYAARIHVAAKEEHPRNARGVTHGHNEGGARAATPPHKCSSIQVQFIHNGYDVRCHQLVRKGPRVARAAAVSAAINENRAIARVEQSWNLIPPVAAVAQAAMQHDHGRARPVRGVPDSSTVVPDIALLIGRGQRRGALGLERSKVVVVSVHSRSSYTR